MPAGSSSARSFLNSASRGYISASTSGGTRESLARYTRPPDVLAEMYPRLAEFWKLRAELDPAGILASDLSRRLGL